MVSSADPRNPAAVDTEGVPPVPEEIFERLRRYHNIRSATFCGWAPDGRGILIRTRSMRGAAEEAPGAYKDVDLVAEATEEAGLARRVAFLRPKACIKG